MEELIEALGGSGKLAKDLGLAQSRVSMWRVNGVAYPWRTAVAKLARRRKVKLPDGFLDPPTQVRRAG